MESPAAQFILCELDKAHAVVEAIKRSPEIIEQLARVAKICAAALEKGRKIMIAGNGGSAADAQHWAAELVGRFYYDRPALPAIALTTDTSILTAVGNDIGFERVFARQVEALGVEGDVLIGISTSGRSRNILAGLEVARNKKVITVGFSGATGGEMQKYCDTLIRVPSRETPHIQEGHEIIGHVLCGAIERELFPDTDHRMAGR
jgi:D-sedoheptulose 7-phosphate isomerase